MGQPSVVDKQAVRDIAIVPVGILVLSALERSFLILDSNEIIVSYSADSRRSAANLPVAPHVRVSEHRRFSRVELVENTQAVNTVGVPDISVELCLLYTSPSPRD